MAMLAEKRRKTKFVLNPVAKPLWMSESEGMQTGKRLMERMGWSAGKGLGASEQGITEPLRSAFKQDSKGMGYKGHGDPFENLDHFNALLASLSNSNSDNDLKEFESLEEKSKLSRSRVHYKKFTRGKDVSRYSTLDLSCIVGVGRKDENKEEEAEEVDTIGDTENSHGVTTINSGSILDYFKDKMAQKGILKRSVENSFLADEDPVPTDQSPEYTKIKKRKNKCNVNDVESNELSHPITNDTNEQDYYIEETIVTKKQKKDKFEDEPVSNDIVEETAILNDNIDEDGNSHNVSTKKKKKSKKDRNSNAEVDDNQDIRVDDEIIDHEVKIKAKKKKKDKSHKNDLVINEVLSETQDSLCNNESDHEQSKVKKKKKDKSHKNDLVINEVLSETQDSLCNNESDHEQSKVKRKKRKRDTCLITEEATMDSADLCHTEILPETDYIPKSKKKKSSKRDKEKTHLEREIEESDQIIHLEDHNEIKSKKKKKSRKDKVKIDDEVECIDEMNNERIAGNDDVKKLQNIQEDNRPQNVNDVSKKNVASVEMKKSKGDLREVADMFTGSNLKSLLGYGYGTARNTIKQDN